VINYWAKLTADYANERIFENRLLSDAVTTRQKLAVYFLHHPAESTKQPPYAPKAFNQAPKE